MENELLVLKIKKFIFFIFGWGMCFHSVHSHAYNLSYTTGDADFHGAVESKKAIVFHDLQWGIFKIPIHNETTTFELMWNMHWFEFEFKSAAFGFDNNESAEVLAFLLIPTFCLNQWEKHSVCFGLGQGTVNMNSSHENRDYGTWNYQAYLLTHLTDQWKMHFQMKYVGNVEQTVNNKYSHFSFSTLGLGLRREF